MSFVDLPEFPSILHLVPWSKTSGGDFCAPKNVLASLIGQQVVVEEKIDGTNVGLTIRDGQVVLRNRNRILNNSHKTRASFQYGPLWNWCYSKIDVLSQVCEDGKYGIYGEWCYVCNTIKYEELPDYLIAFDVMDISSGKWMKPEFRRLCAEKANIPITGLVWSGKAGRDFEKNLRTWVEQKSFYSRTSIREGVIVRPLEGSYEGSSFKVVRPDYRGGVHWSVTRPIVQGLREGLTFDHNP